MKRIGLLVAAVGLLLVSGSLAVEAWTGQPESVSIQAAADSDRQIATVPATEIEAAKRVIAADERFQSFTKLYFDASSVEALPFLVEGERRGVALLVTLSTTTDIEGPWISVDADQLLRTARPDLGDQISIEGRTHDEVEDLLAEGRPLNVNDYVLVEQLETRKVEGVRILIDLIDGRVFEFSPLSKPPPAPPRAVRFDESNVPTPNIKLEAPDHE